MANKRYLEQFKHEVANELGIQPPADGDWGKKTSRECGTIGGHMVRKMIAMAEQSLVGRR